jgi:hypothetical protein
MGLWEGSIFRYPIFQSFYCNWLRHAGSRDCQCCQSPHLQAAGLRQLQEVKPVFIARNILTCKGTLRQVFYLLGPLPSYDPLLTPLTYSFYAYAVYLFTQGLGGGGGERANQREG